MPLNLRVPEGDGPAPAHTHVITRSFAMTVLLAVVLLFALRHLFGTVSAQVGVN
jgi:hypothetical protein